MTDKRLSKVMTHRLRRRSTDSRELAAQLAPLEELARSAEARPAQGAVVATQENGAIVVGVDQSNLANEVIEARATKGPFGLEPVVIFIVGFLLAFIVFIAWLISRMPTPE